MQQVLSQNRKVIGGDGRQLIYVPMAEAGTSPGSGAAADDVAAERAVAGFGHWQHVQQRREHPQPGPYRAPTGREGSER